VVPAVEVMLVNPSVRKLIRDGDDSHLSEVIRGAKGEGMLDLTQSLHDLVKARLVSEAVAGEAAPSAEALAMMLRGIVVGGQQGGILR
jgi:twitching motility protein PilT